jgi:uroporphyrinogen-III synthase
VAEASLAGFTIGITADRRWEEQAELLRRRGASVMHGPAIRTLPIGPEDDLQRVTDQLILDPPSVVIANTGIGMRAWFAAADAWGIGEALMGTLAEARIFARGPKASSAVHQSGLDVTARAESERMDELIDLVIASGVDGCRVAFQRHGEDSPDALLRLDAAGATVVEVPVYRWILPVDLDPARRLIEATVQRRVHAVTFTSAPAVRNLFLVANDLGLESELRDALRSDVIPVVVGPVCAQAAVDAGVDDLVVPDRFRIGPMVRSLTDALLARGRRATIAGQPVSLQGRILHLGNSEISLSEREAGLLAVLLDAAPRVVSRTDLLSGVWDSASDPHVVEVTVGRLRRRVPDLAEGIVAVPRRGYAVRP